MWKRRTILKRLGAASCLGQTGVVTADEPDVMVITELREVGNGLNRGQMVAAQKNEFASFLTSSPPSFGGKPPQLRTGIPTHWVRWVGTV